jgi:hypothetical protein
MSTIAYELEASKVVRFAVRSLKSKDSKFKEDYESSTGNSVLNSSKSELEQYVNESFDYWFDHYVEKCLGK